MLNSAAKYLLVCTAISTFACTNSTGGTTGPSTGSSGKPNGANLAASKITARDAPQLGGRLIEMTVQNGDHKIANVSVMKYDPQTQHVYLEGNDMQVNGTKYDTNSFALLYTLPIGDKVFASGTYNYQGYPSSMTTVGDANAFQGTNEFGKLYGRKPTSAGWSFENVKYEYAVADGKTLKLDGGRDGTTRLLPDGKTWTGQLGHVILTGELKGEVVSGDVYYKDGAVEMKGSFLGADGYEVKTSSYDTAGGYVAESEDKKHTLGGVWYH